jgi:phage-related protein
MCGLIPFLAVQASVVLDLGTTNGEVAIRVKSLVSRQRRKDCIRGGDGIMQRREEDGGRKKKVYDVRLEYRSKKRGRILVEFFNREHATRFLSTDVGSLASAQNMVQTARGAVEPKYLPTVTTRKICRRGMRSGTSTLLAGRRVGPPPPGRKVATRVLGNMLAVSPEVVWVVACM